MYMFQGIIEDIKQLLPGSRLDKQKKELRTLMTQKRRILSTQDVAHFSQDVIEQIKQNSLFQSAKTVMLYYPIQNEIDLLVLYELYPEKTFFLPVTHRKSIEVRQYTGKDNLKKGKFNIPEPIGEAYSGKIDLVFVPGVAFDRQGYRLGRGGGYYDRFLSSLRHTMRIGVGYHFQLVHKIPRNRHDQKMDSVILGER